MINIDHKPHVYLRNLGLNFNFDPQFDIVTAISSGDIVEVCIMAEGLDEHMFISLVVFYGAEWWTEDWPKDHRILDEYSGYV